MRHDLEGVEQAEHFIGMLDVAYLALRRCDQSRQKGRLTAEEAEVFKQALYYTQLLYATLAGGL